MRIDRREFLKIAGATTATIALPVGWVFKPSLTKDFDRNKEYGNSISMTGAGKYTKDQIITALKILIPDARKILPRGVFYEIRAKIPSDYGRSTGFAWYYNRFLPQKKMFYRKPHLEVMGGYLLIARLKI